MSNNDEIKNIKNNIKNSMNYSISSDEEENIKKIYKQSNGKDIIPPKYSYVPKLTIIFSNGETLDAMEFINMIQFEMDFTKYVFPLISLQLRIPTLFIPKIQFDDDIKFNLEIIYKSENEDNPFLNDILFKINLSKIKQNSCAVNIENEVYNEEDKDQYLDKQILELKLIPTECLNANKIVFSGVYHNCTVLDVMTLMSNKLYNKCFIEQPDNLLTYKQMIFIPYNIFYSLQFMDHYYGIYNRGLKLFYAFNQFRIQSNNYFDDNGTNKVKVSFSNNSESVDEFTYQSNGLIKLGNDNLITITPSRIKIVDKRHYIKEILGTNITTFSVEDKYIDGISRNYQIENSNINKSKIYNNEINNEMKELEFFNKTVYTKALEIQLDQILLDIDSWFKVFSINFDSTYYNSLNGKYNLSNYIFRMINTNPDNSGASFKTRSYLILNEI